MGIMICCWNLSDSADFDRTVPNSAYLDQTAHLSSLIRVYTLCPILRVVVVNSYCNIMQLNQTEEVEK